MAGVNRTLFNNERLEENIKAFKDIVSCLEDIANQPDDGSGKSMTKICIEHKINYLNLRRIMELKPFTKIYNDRVIKPADISVYNPYEKLYRTLFKLSENDIVEFPIDLEETIDEVIPLCLTEREIGIIMLRFGFYEDPQTLEQVARTYHVTKDRIMQIEKKVIRKLSNHSYGQMIKIGLLKYNEEKDAKQLQIVEEKKQIKEKLEKRKEELLAEISSGKDIFPIILEESSEVEVVDLDFCCRTYNSLKRGGVKTLKDLLFMTNTDLMKLRNLGMTSLKEIDHKVNEYLNNYCINRKQFLKHFDIDIDEE